MDDDIDFESDTEHEYAASSRRLGKRPAREVDDDFDDDVEDLDNYVRRGGGGGSSSGGTKGGASSSTRRNLEDDAQQDEIDKPTFRPEALQLSAEYLRLFTIEALHRTAAYQREQEDEELRNEETLIELDSLEAITPQLVMDF
ncbi:hypothetical protein BGZ80_011222 [Entomortierella chlamydospora]|uniref:Uncharacterized protein n=1 Tax=Entomortierella chlamydospora TaxID=101097 RepID=A0A9P6MUF5_9FUNG|nr:hypothetical protein BGZ80_011222 [Entomortierella chlamydospora]